jgi:UDP-galactopyranose mutase
VQASPEVFWLRGWRVAKTSGFLLIDRRSHIGGNAYDCHNEHGILIHKYGPHIFHTNSADIFNYCHGLRSGVNISTASGLA